MYYALIQNNTVVHVLRVTPSSIYPDSVAEQYIECNEDVQTGWIWENDEFTAPPVLPARIPDRVTMRQARRALFKAGLISSVNTAIASLPSPQKEEAAIEWEYSQEVQRYNGFVSALSPLLGLTEQQIDDLFVLANTL